MMKKMHFFASLKAAKNISNAFEQNSKFHQADLKILDLPSDFSQRFQR